MYVYLLYIHTYNYINNDKKLHWVKNSYCVCILFSKALHKILFTDVKYCELTRISKTSVTCCIAQPHIKITSPVWIEYMKTIFTERPRTTYQYFFMYFPYSSFSTFWKWQANYKVCFCNFMTNANYNWWLVIFYAVQI